jgi:hypothetical protein
MTRIAGPLTIGSDGRRNYRFLHIVRIEAPIDPVNAEYRIAFAPVGGRLRSRHVMVDGLDRLTAFLRQAHVPTPEIERAWRMLAKPARPDSGNRRRRQRL